MQALPDRFGAQTRRIAFLWLLISTGPSSLQLFALLLLSTFKAAHMPECITEVKRTLQAYHFAGARTIGDEVPRTGEHGIEHEPAQRCESALQPLKVNAVACNGKSSRWLD
ncbi:MULTISPECIES: hypothetical protein [Pseudomonas]|uniref:hypothetical protein n=1 Tax=Pseudomonas TaxID=286 RepID=UPI000F70CF7A|nr:hypothetical protein C4K17_3511 [Pseudomonas chlororaphis subsp. aurantiaca]MBP5076150.1 hypothetical protein [Pseudomonas chlororaphis]QIT20150.1 hypothetical protein HCN09_17090 [Pseudomonas chlororaphis subsp. aurantiaca]QTT79714.1 hypothetical protein HUT29_16915 [Pseudomonas chlororaphis]